MDNRNYLRLELNGRPCVALFDPGATCSLVNKELSEQFSDKLMPEDAAVKMANGKMSDVLGKLKVHFQVDGKSGAVTFRAIENLGHDLLLGMDFVEVFDIEAKLARGLWRIPRGRWRNFNRRSGGKVCAECAGISLCTEDQRKRMDDLVKSMIPEPPQRIGTTHLIEHTIDVQGAQPIKQRPTRMSPEKWKMAIDAMKAYKEDDIIEKCNSGWASRPVLIKKRDGSVRFCIDFRELNKVTRRDAYPLPNMDSILDKLRKAKFITKIDLKQAYHQVALDKASRKYTAFAVPGSGLWQFKKLPFGLCNAPATFQRLVDALFGPEYDGHVFSYLDDIIIVSETFEDHLKWVKFVLERLVGAGLTINPEKCELCCSSVTYLGYRLDEDGLRPDPERVEPVLQYPAPRDVKELRRFLGMVGWYSRFIANDSELKVPLVRLLRKDSVWSWGKEQQEAFEALKQALITAPVLARPDFTKPFTVQCDASSYAIGAVLTQQDEEGEHPIVYVSRVLTPAERNYPVTELECLAMLFAIKKLRPYLDGYHFKVITDHAALKWLTNLREPTGRLARWVLELQQWDFEIEHRKGAYHHVPDALSRGFRPEDLPQIAAFEVIEDEWYVKLRREVASRPEKFPVWKVEDDLLYKYRAEELLDPVTHGAEGWKLVVPANYRYRVMEESHDAPSAAHLGVEKTLNRVLGRYYWPGVAYDVRNYVRKCVTCQKYKGLQTAPGGLMGKRVVEKPWAVVSVDLMEFPPSKNGFKHLVVFQDLFTKWVELKPLRTKTAKLVALALEELILFRWETPDYLVTDNGKEFISKHFQGVLAEYGVAQVTTPPYLHQANPSERVNRTLRTMISSYVGTDHRNWDAHLHEFRHAINTAVQSSTRVSPAFLNFGRQPRLPGNLRDEVEPRGPIEGIAQELWEERMRRLQELRDLVIRHIDEAQTRQARHFDRHRTDVEYRVGDKVLLQTNVLSNAANKVSAKLCERFSGPYSVVQVLGSNMYLLDIGSNKKSGKAHASQLKPFRE